MASVDVCRLGAGNDTRSNGSKDDRQLGYNAICWHITAAHHDQISTILSL